MNKIFIKICGTCGSGKSTIGSEIRDFLQERGFNAKFYDDEQTCHFQESRVQALKDKGIEIVIETVALVTDLTDGTFKTFKIPKKDILCKE